MTQTHSSKTQTDSSKPYVAYVPPPGSLQEWMQRSLAVRGVQEQSASGPTSEPPDVAPAVHTVHTVQDDQDSEPATEPISAPRQIPEPPAPAVPRVPATPEQPAAAAAKPRRARLVVAAGASRVKATAVSGAAQVRHALAGRPTRVKAAGVTMALRMRRRARALGIAFVAVIGALALSASGWQFSETASSAPATAPTVSVTAADTTATSETRLAKPAAFGEVVTLGGWQVKIAGMKDSPLLAGVPGATTAALPRALRMSVTLVNSTGSAQAADGWALSAIVNGQLVKMITHVPAGYVGVPHETIQPGGSIVFPIAVALPTGWADLIVQAVYTPTALAISFAGKA